MTTPFRPLLRPLLRLLASALLASLLLCLPALATDTEADTDAEPRSAGILPASADTFDWPQYRGPDGDGKVPVESFPTDWPADGLPLAWKVPLGGGFSGISAVDGLLYTQYSQDGGEFLAAIDAATGETAWKLRIDDEREDQFGDGPRATPTIDGNLVYAVSAFGKLSALEREKGGLAWRKDLREEYGAGVPTWGIASSPVVVDDLLLHNVGGKPGYLLAAFDKTTGDLAWHSGNGHAGYSLPLTFEVDGVRQTVFFTAKKILGADPATGEILWTRPWSTSYDVNAATPIFIPPNRLFVSSGYDTGSSLFELAVKDDGSGGKTVEPKTVWQSRGMKNQFSSSIYHEGTIYGFDNKIFKAIDADTGEDLWRTRGSGGGFGHGSLFFADGHLVVLGDGGQLALVEASPEAYREKASFQVARGKHWTVPTYYDGHLYVRNEKDLYAFRLPTP